MKGHLRQRSAGTWEMIVYLGRNPETSQKQYRSRTVTGGKRDAQKQLAKWITELQSGTWVESTTLTTGAYLEQWLQDYAAGAVTAKTLERYRQIIRSAITPALGTILLSRLTSGRIQIWYTQLQQPGSRRDRREGALSATTVLQYHRVLRQALAHAVQWQYLARNPADAVTPPRRVRSVCQVLDAAGVVALLAAARESWLYTPIVLAIAGGLRRGEIVALQWEDVDFGSGRIQVRRSLEQTREGLRSKLPKSGRGRHVALPAFAVAELRRHQVRQQEQRVAAGAAWGDEGLVISQGDGRAYPPDYLTRHFTRWLAGHPDLVKVRFHDLRHTHATLLLLQGENPKVVSERLGHSGVGITLDTYSHVLPGIQEAAAGRLDAALGPLIQAPETVSSPDGERERLAGDWQESETG